MTLEEEREAAALLVSQIAALFAASTLPMPAYRHIRVDALRTLLRTGPVRERTAAMRSRTRFVAANHGLVVSTARRFAGQGVEHDELVAAGLEGLLEALDRWEPRGIPFAAYAVSWVRRGALQRLHSERRERKGRALLAAELAVRPQAYEITLSNPLRAAVERLPGRARRVFVAIYQRGQTQRQVSADLELTERQVQRIHRHTKRSLLLELREGRR